MAENISSSNYIIDASFALGFLLPDEHSAKVDKIFRQFANGNIILESTFLLGFEIANALTLAKRRKRITFENAKKLLRLFQKWDIKYTEVKLDEVLKISLEKDISAYDASYLWLSKKKGYKLLTLDKKLQNL